MAPYIWYGLRSPMTECTCVERSRLMMRPVRSAHVIIDSFFFLVTMKIDTVSNYFGC